MSRVKKYNSTTSEWEYADGPAGNNFVKSSTTGNLTVSDTQPSSPLESDVWIEPGGKIGTSGIDDGAVTASKIDFATLKPAPVQTTATFSTASTTPTLITGMTITHTIPDGAVAMIVLSAPYVNSSQANAYAELGIWVGNVGTGTRIAGTSHRSYMAGGLSSQTAIGFITGDGTSKTFNASLNAAGGGTASVSVVNANTPISLAIVY